MLAGCNGCCNINNACHSMSNKSRMINLVPFVYYASVSAVSMTCPATERLLRNSSPYFGGGSIAKVFPLFKIGDILRINNYRVNLLLGCSLTLARHLIQ